MSAVTEVRPPLSWTPLAAPATAVRLLTFVVKSAAAFLESITRRYSRPPRTFLPLAGTMNGSLPVPRNAAYGILSPVVRLGVGATAMSKSGGVTDFCSFSSHDPQDTNAAWPRHHSVCDWMWSMPSAPGCRYP